MPKASNRRRISPERAPSPASVDSAAAPRGSPGEVFFAFLKLGLTSFGGPIAHLGYFQDELVRRRRWIDEAGYADLVALCQFLPGPASSQVGFALGLMRGGLPGALAAWTAFTLPSAGLLVLFALGATALADEGGSGLLHGLQLVAVAVIAQAVWGMARTLAPDRTRATIAVAATLLVVVLAGSLGQIGAIVTGGLAGLWLCKQEPATPAAHSRFPVKRATALAALGLSFLLLAALPAASAALGSQALALFDSFYRAGALVFGGGHVVLPLLEAEVVDSGWLSREAFLAGYGAAQAVPGPLFTFAAYIGMLAGPSPLGLPGAVIGLAAIFAPGLLLLVGTLPFWDAFRTGQSVQGAMRGANAAVVGILGAALYDPVWTNTIQTPLDFALALVGFLLLVVWKAPPWVVVLFTAAGGIALGLI